MVTLTLMIRQRDLCRPFLFISPIKPFFIVLFSQRHSGFYFLLPWWLPTLFIPVWIKSFFDIPTCARSSSDCMWCQQKKLHQPSSGITLLVLEEKWVLTSCEPESNFRSLINPKCEINTKGRDLQELRVAQSAIWFSKLQLCTLATAQGRARYITSNESWSSWTCHIPGGDAEDVTLASPALSGQIEILWFISCMFSTSVYTKIDFVYHSKSWVSQLIGTCSTAASCDLGW